MSVRAKRINLKATTLVVCGLLTLTLSVQLASAWWSNSGIGTSSATTATMPAGLAPTTSVLGDTVTVTVDQVEIAGLRIGSLAGGGYEIKRYLPGGGSPVDPGGDCTALLSGSGATLSCDDTSVPIGSWRYTATPVLHSWTGDESPTSNTAVIPPDPPSGLTSTAAPAAEIDLNWSAVSGADGYNIYRRVPPAAFDFGTPLNGATPHSGTSFTDATAVSGTNYGYVVRAVVVDAFSYQTESANSNEPAAVTADGDPPSPVTIVDPPAIITGTIVIDAGAPSDPISGVQSVRIERQPAGVGPWTTVCTDTTAPYSCSFDSTTVADGNWEFRAVATDNVGNSASSPTSSVRVVDNDAPVATADNPGTWVRGTVTLSGSATDTGSGVATTTLQGRAIAGAWANLASSPSNNVSVNYDTTTLADGAYEIRVEALDNAGHLGTSPTITPINVDNTAPTGVSITDPGTPLRGTVTLFGTATDGGGVADVTFQFKPSAGSTWSDSCSDTTSPYSCDFDTTTLSDGNHDFRAVATDLAGNQTISAAVNNRYVDNTGPTGVTLTAPPAYIRATITINAGTPSDPSGIASVAIQRSPAGAGTWTSICTDTTPAYSCSFNSTGVTDGLYDFRALATDGGGNQTASTVSTDHTVDNTRPTAADIQTINAGALGRPETGDQIVFTFSESIQPATILTGFTGASLAATVRLNNNGANDRVQLWNAANTTRAAVGEVRTGGNYVAASRTFTASTMVMSGSVLTVTLGTPSGAVNTVAANATLDWRPAATPLDLAGNVMMNTARLETGTADPNF